MAGGAVFLLQPTQEDHHRGAATPSPAAHPPQPPSPPCRCWLTFPLPLATFPWSTCSTLCHPSSQDPSPLHHQWRWVGWARHSRTGRVGAPHPQGLACCRLPIAGPPGRGADPGGCGSLQDKASATQNSGWSRLRQTGVCHTHTSHHPLFPPTTPGCLLLLACLPGPCPPAHCPRVGGTRDPVPE